jgi:hypothetical protein
MDPYLEKPGSWFGTHNVLIVAISAALNAVLPPQYAATVEERCYIAGLDRDVIRPDLVVQETLRPSARRAGTAIAESIDPPLVLRTYPLEEKEAYIDILNVETDERIVTTLELLNYTNKTLRNKGRALYRKKQAEILASQTHLIEIDLLRTGEHTVAVPAIALQEREHWDYLICLHRSGHGEEFEVWLNSVRQRLPRIAIPLDVGVPDVALNLQAVLDRCYHESAFDRRIDYRKDPVPPLRAADAAWADALLRANGLRPEQE